jgi:hypothetical protein
VVTSHLRLMTQAATGPSAWQGLLLGYNPGRSPGALDLGSSWATTPESPPGDVVVPGLARPADPGAALQALSSARFSESDYHPGAASRRLGESGEGSVQPGPDPRSEPGP